MDPRKTDTKLTKLALLCLLSAVMALFSGCSRVSIVYNSADFAAREYAKDYLKLTTDQLDGWEPALDAELERHRREELPYLAAFFDQALKASQTGFNKANTECMTESFTELYKRQARTAVHLAAPLLAELTPNQINELDKKFRREAREDRADLAKRNRAWELKKRAKRYSKSIANWTGPLTEQQKGIVEEITGRIPETEAEVVDYRTAKRDRLVAMLRRNASKQEIERYLTNWLVDFTDLPPQLKRAGNQIGERMSELLIRLGATFDAKQRKTLQRRLRDLRNDLLDLQKSPHLAPLQCSP